jgi:hypothetical protein
MYRVIEFALGIFGYPFTHEWMFLVFESAPMVPAIMIFCFWHPAAYFGTSGKAEPAAQAESSNEGSKV